MRRESFAYRHKMSLLRRRLDFLKRSKQIWFVIIPTPTPFRINDVTFFPRDFFTSLLPPMRGLAVVCGREVSTSQHYVFFCYDQVKKCVCAYVYA